MFHTRIKYNVGSLRGGEGKEFKEKIKLLQILNFSKPQDA